MKINGLALEKVYVYPDRKDLYAYRQGNQTLLCPKSPPRIADSDRTVLTDKRGHRYARNSVDLEIKLETDYYIFNMI